MMNKYILFLFFVFYFSSARSLQGVGPSLQQRLCEERILTLGQVVEVWPPPGQRCRPGLTSEPQVSPGDQPPAEELALIAAHCNGLKFTNDNDSFPEMLCFS
ncbi:Thymidylate kinase [Dissostichus eleginoides]|uniref:Thymidylate kinase n=1 Tax=Dissostichus eleginoides TaxID=100907 RepID=A0AAD9CD75_DISEL|nr:Thymidylate kinase [Dissostichus eleginoides]